MKKILNWLKLINILYTNYKLSNKIYFKNSNFEENIKHRCKCIKKIKVSSSVCDTKILIKINGKFYKALVRCHLSSG